MTREEIQKIRDNISTELDMYIGAGLWPPPTGMVLSINGFVKAPDYEATLAYHRGQMDMLKRVQKRLKGYTGHLELLDKLMEHLFKE